MTEERQARVDDFDLAYRHAHAGTVRLAYLLSGRLPVAEELAHEAWVNCYRRHLDQPIADVESYVRRAVVNGARSRARRTVLERAYLRSVDGWAARGVASATGSGRDRRSPELRRPESEARIEAVGDRMSLVACLQQLPTRMRTAVVLRHYMDLSVADTAAVMHVSEGAVKSATARGLSTLKRLWQDEVDDV